MEKHRNTLVLISVLASLLVLFILPKTSSRPTPSLSAPLESPLPIFQTKPQEEEIVSPDMKYKMIVKKEIGKNLTTYTISTQGEKEEVAKQIFSMDADNFESLSVPFNTWAPENKYIFLKTLEKERASYIVMTSNGKPFTNKHQTINVEDLFSEKYSEYIITDVTGWAGPTLLVINTNNADGTIGPSFWLDMSSLNFIRLSTRFN